MVFKFVLLFATLAAVNAHGSAGLHTTYAAAPILSETHETVLTAAKSGEYAAPLEHGSLPLTYSAPASTIALHQAAPLTKTVSYSAAVPSHSTIYQSQPIATKLASPSLAVHSAPIANTLTYSSQPQIATLNHGARLVSAYAPAHYGYSVNNLAPALRTVYQSGEPLTRVSAHHTIAAPIARIETHAAPIATIAKHETLAPITKIAGHESYNLNSEIVAHQAIAPIRRIEETHASPVATIARHETLTPITRIAGHETYTLNSGLAAHQAIAAPISYTASGKAISYEAAPGLRTIYQTQHSPLTYSSPIVSTYAPQMSYLTYGAHNLAGHGLTYSALPLRTEVSYNKLGEKLAW